MAQLKTSQNVLYSILSVMLLLIFNKVSFSSRTSVRKLVQPLTSAASRPLSKSQLSRPKVSPIAYRVRLATNDDIPAIHQCNLDTLPENFSPNFYRTFLARYPRLSLIAETHEKELMGYALGKVEQDQMSLLSASFQLREPEPTYLGHVNSIAVYEHHRGQGVAKQLMKCLHYNFVKQYYLDKISLHVRVSNLHAKQMYENNFKYKIDHIKPGYYLDHEDAYYMIRTNLLNDYDELISQEEIDLITSQDNTFIDDR